MIVITETRSRRIDDNIRIYAIPYADLCNIYITIMNKETKKLDKRLIGSYYNTRQLHRASEIYLKPKNKTDALKMWNNQGKWCKSSSSYFQVRTADLHHSCSKCHRYKSCSLLMLELYNRDLKKLK